MNKGSLEKDLLVHKVLVDGSALLSALGILELFGGQ